MTTRFIVNHLWQSSCFALLAGLLALVLRKNSPGVRYWVWLSASLKFLAPFALLMSLGSVLPRPARRATPVPAAVFPNALAEIAEPFASPPHSPVPAHNSLEWIPVTLGIVWSLGFMAIVSVRFRGWLRVRATLKDSKPVKLPIALPALMAPSATEPGVVGFLKPVLVLPAQLMERLSPRQLDAVLTHELCHVRRRDNFFAAIHMGTEALFWFHPLVWWIGSRMLEERELACDEEVLRMGCAPAEYVEGILKVCRFCTGSPLPCVSGVTGAAVKKRLRTILTGKVAPGLSPGRKLILALAAVSAVAVPIAVGFLDAPKVNAQAPANASQAVRPAFEVASIRRCPEAEFTAYLASLSVGGAGRGGGRAPTAGDPGMLRLVCRPLSMLILQAYLRFPDGEARKPVFEPRSPVRGGPAWIDDRYTIDARPESPQKQGMMAGPMLQALLEDRFRLKVHRASSEIPAYALVVARGGPKLGPAKDCPVGLPPDLKQTRCGYQSFTDAGMDAHGWRMANLADVLGSHLNRRVIDRTGIAEAFDFHLDLPLPPPPGSPGIDDPNTPDLFGTVMDAVEKLGLKLDPVKDTDEFLVIDRIERPTEN